MSTVIEKQKYFLKNDLLGRTIVMFSVEQIIFLLKQGLTEYWVPISTWIFRFFLPVFWEHALFLAMYECWVLCLILGVVLCLVSVSFFICLHLSVFCWIPRECLLRYLEFSLSIALSCQIIRLSLEPSCLGPLRLSALSHQFKESPGPCLGSTTCAIARKQSP